MYVNGMEHTEEFYRARHFYRSLCRKVNGSPDRQAQGIMSEELIAEHMNMPVKTVTELLWSCAAFGITERQGGGWVV